MRSNPSNSRRNAETRRLLELFRVTHDPSLKERIVAMHERLVYSVARKYVNSGEPLEDLIQEGFVGLLRAIDLYDPSFGARFSTYATHKISGAIKHYLRDRARMIHRPAWVQDLGHKVRRETERLVKETGREPDPAEIAAALGRDEEEVRTAIQALRSAEVESLDALVHRDSAGEQWLLRRDVLASSEDAGLVDRVALRHAISSLPDQQLEALRLFYYEGMGYRELARTLQVSTSKARRLLGSAMAVLRRTMLSELNPS
ncbi:MAG: sigma-70 family RNA polymerase sigma factor [Armatimonadota bacterium]